MISDAVAAGTNPKAATLSLPTAASGVERPSSSVATPTVLWNNSSPDTDTFFRVNWKRATRAARPSSTAFSTETPRNGNLRDCQPRTNCWNRTDVSIDNRSPLGRAV